MNILIFGKTGQLGSNFYELLCAHSEQGNCLSEESKKIFRWGNHPAQDDKCKTLFAERKDVDFSDLQSVQNYLKNLDFKPDFIINCVAYTAVDKAEDEKDLCKKINVDAVKIIAEFCKKIGAVLVHYSTDYVFDGLGNNPFTEDNSTNLKPLNYYGLTKLESEKVIQNSGCNHFIFRISWVYNHSGKNFALTILRLAAEREELKIVADQIGSPCYSMDIAKATLQIIDKKTNKFGTYNLTQDKYISWFDFTKMIVEKGKKYNFPIKVKEILPIKTSEYPVKATRPLNSKLSSDKAFKVFGIKLPKIESSLEEFFKKIS